MHALRPAIVLGLSVLLLSSCSLMVQREAPVSTPAPPSTVAPTTPPTATAHATAAPSPADILAQAIADTAALDSYRMRFQISGENIIPIFTEDQAFNIQSQSYILLRDGPRTLVEFGTRPMHPERPLAFSGEIIWVKGGDIYAHNYDPAHYSSIPLPFPGVDRTGWYNLGPQAPEVVPPPLPDGQEMLSMLTRGTNLRDFVADEEVQVDGHHCAIYHNDAPSAVRTVTFLTKPIALPPDTQALHRDAQQWVTTSLTICDGYVRQIKTLIQITMMPSGHFASWLQVDLVFADQGRTQIELPTEAPQLLFVHKLGTATVWNGGNVRAAPVSGAPRDQANAGELLDLYAQSADGGWYLVRTPRRIWGWISATLVTRAPPAQALPVAAVDQLVRWPATAAPEATLTPTAEPVPLAWPTVEPSQHTFSSGPLRITAPLYYKGGDMTRHKAEILAEIRAINLLRYLSEDIFEVSGDDIDLLLYSPSANRSSLFTTVIVRHEPTQSDTSLDAYIDQKVAQLPGYYQVMSKGRFGTGEPAIGQIETIFRQGDRRLGQWIVLYPHKDELWVVTFSTDYSRLAAMRPQFEQMAHSIQFETP
jgi:hypothetical protein